MSTRGNVAVVFSAHPDDEVVGIGATVVNLIDQGWTVHNVACTLGSSNQDRRLAEVRDACGRLGAKLDVLDLSSGLSATSDLEKSFAELTNLVRARIETIRPRIVISSHTEDGHHAHETVARAVKAAIETTESVAPAWWQYGIWVDLPAPTLYLPFGRETMERLLDVLAAYPGEMERNPYDVMYPARATYYKYMGSERVFGYGTSVASEAPYADLAREMKYANGVWGHGPPRLMEATDLAASKTA